MPRIDPTATEWRFIEGEILGLDLNTEEYFSIKGSGVPLWRQMADGASEQELASLLIDRYGLPLDRAAEDVRAFLTSLRARGLIES